MICFVLDEVLQKLEKLQTNTLLIWGRAILNHNTQPFDGFVSKELPFPPHICRFGLSDDAINAKVDVCISPEREWGRKGGHPSSPVGGQYVDSHGRTRGLNTNTQTYSEATSRNWKYKYTNKNTSWETYVFKPYMYVSYVLLWLQCLFLLTCIPVSLCCVLCVCVFGAFVCLLSECSLSIPAIHETTSWVNFSCVTAAY